VVIRDLSAPKSKNSAPRIIPAMKEGPNCVCFGRLPPDICCISSGVSIFMAIIPGAGSSDSRVEFQIPESAELRFPAS
jgi:hypothetical protein